MRRSPRRRESTHDGPSIAKKHFLDYLHEHARALAGKVVGVETIDHPTDAQLVEHVKSHFRITTLRAT